MVGKSGLDKTRHEARIAALLTAIEPRLGDQLVSVTPFREGVDCFVDEVLLSDGRRAVLRTWKHERLETTYDGLVDARQVSLTEVAAAELLAEAGVPVPCVLAWSRATPGTDECSWMLSELIEHTLVDTLEAATQRQLGELARRIHDVEPRGVHKETLTQWNNWEEWVVDRIVRRLDAARAYVPLPDGAAIRRRLSGAIAGRGAYANRLLHLDLRPPNVAVVDGRIVAVFDFANAICGDPYLELARVMQCDLLTPAFQTGYGCNSDELQSRAELLCAYSLDLTAMLVVVSREEFDDLALQQEMSRRTLSLVETLLA